MIVTGVVVKCCPLLGDVIVAATFGAGPGMPPVMPIEPDCGGGDTADAVQIDKAKPTATSKPSSGKYEVNS